jgi:ankyrin repeat protein
MTDVALELIEEGVDIDAKNIIGDTALHLACWRGMKDVALKLIEKGATIDAEVVEESASSATSAAVEQAPSSLPFILMSSAAPKDVLPAGGEDEWKPKPLDSADIAVGVDPTHGVAGEVECARE